MTTPSVEECPGTECPPLRTALGKLSCLAKAIVAASSAADLQRTTAAGRTLWNRTIAGFARQVIIGRVRQYDTAFDRRLEHLPHRGASEEVFGSGISRAHASTALYVDVDRFDAVDGVDWSAGELFVGARLDLLHRLLRRELRTGLDPGGVEMRVVEMIGAAMDIDGAPARQPSGATAGHRHITADVLEALEHADGSFSLIELSHTVGCSPFHLSRIFHHSTG